MTIDINSNLNDESNIYIGDDDESNMYLPDNDLLLELDTYESNSNTKSIQLIITTVLCLICVMLIFLMFNIYIVCSVELEGNKVYSPIV